MEIVLCEPIEHNIRDPSNEPLPQRCPPRLSQFRSSVPIPASLVTLKETDATVDVSLH